MIPVVVVSLVPPILVALVAIAAFYFYRTHRSDKPGPPARPDWPTKRTSELYQALDRPCGRLGAREEDGGESGTGPGSQGEESNAKVSPSSDDMWQGQRAEPLPIKLEVLVGKGRFAEVWRARLLQDEKGEVNSYETVAVKVFPSVEYTSWRNECSIFSDPKLEHDNVVRFLAAEERGPPSHTLRTYWLVLDYHSLGNLQDFLTANILSWEELITMSSSIAKGVAHLHSDTTPSGEPKVNPAVTNHYLSACMCSSDALYTTAAFRYIWTPDILGFIVLSRMAEVYKDGLQPQGYSFVEFGPTITSFLSTQRHEMSGTKACRCFSLPQ